MADIPTGASASPTGRETQSAELHSGSGWLGSARIAPNLGLAAPLAGTALALDIAPPQAGAWFDYCQAVIRLLEPDAVEGPNGLPLLDRRLADRLLPANLDGQVLARTEKARRLIAAASALHGVLEPHQIERVRCAGPEWLRPELGMNS